MDNPQPSKRKTPCSGCPIPWTFKEETAKLEEQVRERTAALEASNANLKQFAYAVSHDLREPMHKIEAFGERLESRYGEVLEGKGLEYLHVMRSGARRMLILIDDLLTYARIGDQENVVTEEVDLEGVVRGVVEALSEQITETKARVEVGVLPTVRGVPSMLFVLFQNLISNSLKFRHPSRPLFIEIFSKEEGVVVVQDNGIGFSPEFQDRIFQVFERLHSRFNYPGTGIGLALCKQVMAQHKGWIRAIGAPDEGASFVLGFLPESLSNGP